ncbi:MAG: RNA methyltransferase [Gemmatimonadetes bacterium]|nr:RNA methyltransferase [Gemmatimonadota bacterium]
MSAGRDGYRKLLADIERVGTSRGRRTFGRYAIEGIRLAERAIRSGVHPTHALVSASFDDERSNRVQSLLRELREGGALVEIAPDAVLLTLSEGRKDGNIVTLVPLPEERSLRQLIEAGPVLLVACDVEDPGNVGAMARTSLASGAPFVSVGRSDLYHPRAVRIGRGSHFRIVHRHYESYDDLAKECAREGVAFYASVSSGGIAPRELAKRLRRPAAILMGQEAFGLSRAAIEASEERVTIPMATAMDSLSVSAASAILLYELLQRT